MKYQIRDNWVVWTNYCSSTFTYGTSRSLSKTFYYGAREKIHILGYIKTFKVKLFKLIKKEDLQDRFGKFFDIGIDEALQYPLLELAGKDHSEYVNEICYFANKDYENTSNPNLDRHREEVKDLIYMKKRYKRIDHL